MSNWAECGKNRIIKVGRASSTNEKKAETKHSY